MDLPHRKDIIASFESPIEEMLYNELRSEGLYPATQFQIGPYRADLAFPEIMIVVECDGKEWHSSPEQIEHDNKRDRYMEERGWTVLRVVGSLIYSDAEEVAKIVRDAYLVQKARKGIGLIPYRVPTQFEEGLDDLLEDIQQENNYIAFENEERMSELRHV